MTPKMLKDTPQKKKKKNVERQQHFVQFIVVFVMAWTALNLKGPNRWAGVGVRASKSQKLVVSRTASACGQITELVTAGG